MDSRIVLSICIPYINEIMLAHISTPKAIAMLGYIFLFKYAYMPITAKEVDKISIENVSCIALFICDERTICNGSIQIESPINMEIIVLYVLFFIFILNTLAVIIKP